MTHYLLKINLHPLYPQINHHGFISSLLDFSKYPHIMFIMNIVYDTVLTKRDVPISLIDLFTTKQGAKMATYTSTFHSSNFLFLTYVIHCCLF